jgi:hypothetical protein
MTSWALSAAIERRAPASMIADVRQPKPARTAPSGMKRRTFWIEFDDPVEPQKTQILNRGVSRDRSGGSVATRTTAMAASRGSTRQVRRVAFMPRL